MQPQSEWKTVPSQRFLTDLKIRNKYSEIPDDKRFTTKYRTEKEMFFLLTLETIDNYFNRIKQNPNSQNTMIYLQLKDDLEDLIEKYQNSEDSDEIKASIVYDLLNEIMRYKMNSFLNSIPQQFDKDLKILRSYIYNELNMKGDTFHEHFVNTQYGRRKPGLHNPQHVNFRNAQKNYAVPFKSQSYRDSFPGTRPVTTTNTHNFLHGLPSKASDSFARSTRSNKRPSSPFDNSTHYHKRHKR